MTEHGQSLVKRLSLADEDGLDTPTTLLALIQTGATPNAPLEVALSRAAVTYAREARGSRIDPTKLSKSLTPKLDIPDGLGVLQHLAQADKAGDALWHYNPKHAGYIALRAKLAEWREATASLAETPGISRTAEGKRTLPLQLNDFLSNMERWRWLPVNAGDSRIEVNIPEYTMRLYGHGTLKHTGRVVVGKTNTQTPVFSSVMDHVVINPSWGVPYSILKNEFLPKLAADPDYAERHG
ncbi:MAG: L,D-transpeptidase family protein, partial [Hyphomicrobiales bacterium]|nr:L,D-transpeptidase family protein [Hyphomicrobiales bacterium]